MILVIDNYDSFTFNLVELFRRQQPVQVYRNDEITVDEIRRLAPSGMVISPGPGRPEDSGVSLAAVRELYTEMPILGICLGHQIIAEVLGGNVTYAQQPMHGKSSYIYHRGTSVFKGLPNPMEVMRYHSLLVDRENLPGELEVTAATPEGEIMGIKHKMYNLVGVQFHPESILSPQGAQLATNWLKEIICS